MVYLTDNELIRKVFMNPGGKLRLFLIFGAEKILGSNNIAFMHGPEHAALRKQLLPLFTSKALSTYLGPQERNIRATLEKLLARDKPESVRLAIRDLIIDTSCDVFIGSYLPKQERTELARLYMYVNDGLLCIPIAFPGGGQWKAVQARKKVVEMLESSVEQSKKRMKNGEEPNCLLDFWMEEQHRLSQLSDEPVPFSDTYKIACTLLDFLFASQDATTSAMVWLLTLTEQHKEVFDKIREEQLQVRPNDESVTQELLDQMIFTRQVVHETLRFRVPTTMMPHVVQEDNFELTKNVTIPKGAIIMGSIWSSHFQGFTNPFQFDPDRWGPERQEDVKYGKYFLPFGTGAHMCLGRQYAINNLISFIGIFARNADLKRERTATSDDIIFTPTLLPGDLCIMGLKKSEHYSAPIVA
jgi:cytochrome P450 family 710 subfamily A protein